MVQGPHYAWGSTFSRRGDARYSPRMLDVAAAITD